MLNDDSARGERVLAWTALMLRCRPIFVPPQTKRGLVHLRQGYVDYGTSLRVEDILKHKPPIIRAYDDKNT